MTDFTLSPDQRQHFVEHGWLKIPQAIKPKYLEEWTSNLFIRLGWDPEDRTTWASNQKMGTYVKLPRHREVLASELAPRAWAAMCEIVGGEDKIDPVRERYHGDQLIINFGNEYWTKVSSILEVLAFCAELLHLQHASPPPHLLNGWHADNDWYRQFLDSSGNALTIIHLFTDIPPSGGGTWICEDGIKRSCRVMYDNPDGWDPPDHDRVLHEAIKRGECEKFVQIEGQAGDVFITHAMLPHAPGINHLWYPRIITNPHVNLKEPFNLNRSDGNYVSEVKPAGAFAQLTLLQTLCEQVILRALDRTSLPEWKPTRERKM